MNVYLDGKLTDTKDPILAGKLLNQILPGVQFYINSNNKTCTGVSPFEIERGYNPKGIIDVVAALDQVNQAINKNINVKGALECFEDLLNKIHLLRDQRDRKELKNIWRYKNNYEIGKNGKNNIKLDVFNVGDEVMFFIGNCNNNTQKWQARFSGPFIIEEMINPGTALIYSKELDLKITSAVGMLKRVYVKTDWMKEMNYSDWIKKKQSILKMKENSKISPKEKFSIELPNTFE